MLYKGFNVPDDVIDSYVDKLGCSIVEACDAWLCDNGKAVCDEQETMTKKAQFMGVGKVVNADYKKADRKPRERKPNELKEALIIALADFLKNECEMVIHEDFVSCDEVEITNKNRMIHFKIGEKEFELQLVEKRDKKNKEK